MCDYQELGTGQMCDYQELRKFVPDADRRIMHPEQLSRMVETGRYKPDPALVAQAMLRRRGMRVLLTSAAPVTPVDRSPEAREVHPKAA
jgi:hypothetical protein